MHTEKIIRLRDRTWLTQPAGQYADSLLAWRATANCIEQRRGSAETYFFTLVTRESRSREYPKSFSIFSILSDIEYSRGNTVVRVQAEACCPLWRSWEMERESVTH